MENASKALVIAGSVLVSILLVATGVQVYNSTGKGSAEQAKQASEKMWENVDLSLGLQGTKVEKVEIEPKLENYEIGQEVTIGEEHFFVIAEDDEKIILFAEYKINIQNLVQEYNAGGIQFSETNYWATDFANNEENRPYNLIEEGEPDDSHYAAKVAYDYGLKIGGKGRLMTLAEANNCSVLYSDLLYWLGTAYNEDAVRMYDGYEGGITANTYNWAPGWVGVRPVVEISKANI